MLKGEQENWSAIPYGMINPSECSILILEPISGFQLSDEMAGQFLKCISCDFSDPLDNIDQCPTVLIERILQFKGRQLLIVSNIIGSLEVALLSKSLAAGFDTFISVHELKDSDLPKVLRLFFMGATVFTISEFEAEFKLSCR